MQQANILNILIPALFMLIAFSDALEIRKLRKSDIQVEQLAKELHEAGREAVEQGATVAAGMFGNQSRRFLGWHEISDAAREGRKIQARYLLGHYVIRSKA